MINNLEIINGNLDLEFNENIDTYTVSVNNNVSSLIFDISLIDGVKNNIYNNVLDNDINEVYLEVFNNYKKDIYKFIVYKDNYIDVLIEEENIYSIDNYDEITKNEIYGIITSAIILVLFFTILIFKKRRM